MATAVDLSTAGIQVAYAVEATAGTKPTTGWTKFTGIKSIPDFNPEPSSLETTTLDATEYRTYIPGLKDVGGAVAYTANMTEQFQTEWDALMAAYKAAAADGKALWITHIVPGLTKAFFFKGEPSPLGFSAVDTDSVFEVDAYVAPTQIEGWGTKPTLT